MEKLIDIFAYIKKDHEKVAEIFEKILASHSASTRVNLFKEVDQELRLHKESEEKTFYKAIKNCPDLKDRIPHANKEHKEIEDYLDEIEGMSAENKLWLEKLGELKHSVEHHVDEEETEIFPKAKKFLTKEQALELAVEMDKLKQEMKKKLHK